jgi:hypothetical protein
VLPIRHGRIDGPGAGGLGPARSQVSAALTDARPSRPRRALAPVSRSRDAASGPDGLSRDARTMKQQTKTLGRAAQDKLVRGLSMGAVK